MNPTHSLLGLALFATSTAAQATWIVDALGGPGVLPTLAAAEQAAADGDTVLVRPTGVYDFGLTTSKGLTILGAGPGPTAFTGRLVVHGLSLPQRFVLRGFAGQAAPNPGSLAVEQCLGAVVLEDLVLQAPPQGAAVLQALAVLDSRQVTLHHGTCSGAGYLAVTVFASEFAASECSFLGSASAPVGVGLASYGSRLHLTSCQMLGGIGLEMSSAAGVPSLVTMAGGAAIGMGPGTTGAVLWPGSTLRLDATAVVSGTLLGTVVPYESGQATLGLAPPGQPGTASCLGPAGDFGALLLGLPAYPTATPLGDLWFDAQAYVVVGLGLVPVQAPFTTPVAATQGLALVAQGLLLHQGTFRLSGPVRALVP